MKKIILLIVALTLTITSVSAENAGARFQDLKELNVSLKAEIVKYNAFSGETLKAIKQWVSDSNINLHIKDDEYFTKLYYKGSPLMSFYKDDKGFQIDDTHYYEGSGEDFYKLLGAKDPLNKYRNIKAALDAAPDLLENLCLDMADIAQTKKGGTAIKKLVKPAETITYTLDGEVLDSFWKKSLTGFNDNLTKNGAEEDFAQNIVNKLSAMRFEGKCTVRQLVTEDGQPFAWRFSGFALINGVDKRKTSMTFGRTREGLYIKLSMPATRGKNKLNINAAASLKNDKLLTDGNFAIRDEKLNTSGRFDVSLNVLGGVKGKVDYRIKRRNEKEKRYVIRPSAEIDDQGVSGKLSYKYNEGDRETYLNFIIAGIAPEEFIKSQSIVKTANLNESSMALERESIAGIMSKPLIPLIKDVPQEQRAKVLHEITRLFRLTDYNNKQLDIPKYTVIQEEQ